MIGGEDGEGETGPGRVRGWLHREVTRGEEVAGHHQEEEVLDPVGQNLASNVAGEGDGEYEGQDGTCGEMLRLRLSPPSVSPVSQ